jgi:hypothetical protein
MPLGSNNNAPKYGPSYDAFNKAKLDFNSNDKKIPLEVVRDAIIEALELKSALIFNQQKPPEGLKEDAKTDEYDNMFLFVNLQHRAIIEQVATLLGQDSQLNSAIATMVAPENKNLEEGTKEKLKQLKINLGVLQGLVLREKLKRGSALNIDPLLDALNDKVKTLSSILAVQKTGNVNFQLGGSLSKLHNVSNYVKYKMKYLTIKYGK